ncbi:hypothetical protein ACTU6U_04180 [Microbacterium sp. A196]|uniref:hypothetical protein n=1 Tax=Microbacterium sp. A196 TaxID=3457320 RepID=UPI003FCFDD13
MTLRVAHTARAPRARTLVATVVVLLGIFSNMTPTSANAAIASPSGVSVAASSRNVSTASIKPAADLRHFNPGDIMSDEVFFNGATMTEAEIDAFLRAKVSSCQSGYVCLKDFRQTTASKGADSYCRGYNGAAGESAARIIYKVAVSCGINPRVLLVILQKEQGLVTHSWPSEFRYRSAMGQGCPDTAACDAQYYGFQNQVFGAARQFQIYAEGRYFTYYAPGKTWSVLYNPNRACGSSPVYIANKATAGLYYYTPYQPNAAALNAGYGEGDGCSAYGNRNFYQYFVDWFGSTQISNMTIVKSVSSADVYLISENSRWRIEDLESFGELNAAYGPMRLVSDATVGAYSLKGTTKSILRDQATGTIAMVQGGQMHRIPSCEIVTYWGSACATPTNVSTALFNRLPMGAEVSTYFQVRGTSTWGRFDSSTTATPFFDSRAAAALNNTPGSPPYAPYITAGQFAALTKAAPYYAPISVVKADNDSKVYLTVDFDKLVWIRNWTEVVEYGVGPGSMVTVPASGLSRYRDTGLVIKTGLRCGSATYLVAGGALAPVGSSATAGLPVMDAGAQTCAQLPSTGVAGTVLAVKTATSPSVSIIEAGKQRSVLSWDLLVQANAGAAPSIATVQPATLATFPTGPAMADGQVVKVSNSPDIMFVSGQTAYRIPSAGVADDLGIGLAFTMLSDEAFSGLTKGIDIGPFVTCAGQSYVAASGDLWQISSQVMAVASTVEMSAPACARIDLQSNSARDRIFVKSSTSGDVYVVEGGTAQHVTSWATLVTLAGTSSPQILTLSSSSLAVLPKGNPV